MEKEQTTLVAFQATVSERDDIDRKAALLGITRSEFIRRASRNTQVEQIQVAVMQSQPLFAA